MFREGHYTGLLKIVPEDGKPAEIELTPSQAMAVIAASVWPGISGFDWCGEYKEPNHEKAEHGER